MSAFDEKLPTQVLAFLYCITEDGTLVDNKLSGVRHLIPMSEKECQRNGHYHDEGIATNIETNVRSGIFRWKQDTTSRYSHKASNHARLIMGRVLAAKHKTAGNTPNTTEGCQRRGAESSFPLPTNVIRLISHNGWDVAIGPGNGDKYAGVLRCW